MNSRLLLIKLDSSQFDLWQLFRFAFFPSGSTFQKKWNTQQPVDDWMHQMLSQQHSRGRKWIKWQLKRTKKWSNGTYFLLPCPVDCLLVQHLCEAHFADKSKSLILISKMRVVQIFLYTTRVTSFPTVNSWGHVKYISECKLLSREQFSKG